MTQLRTTVELSETKAAKEEKSLREMLRDDLAWYGAKSSALKDPEKEKLAQECVERIRRILET